MAKCEANINSAHKMAHTGSKTTEQKGMNKQTDRYQQNVDASKATIEKTDPLRDVLYTLENTFHNERSELGMCLREPVCRCKNTRECVCDSDAFINLTDVKMEVASNCVFIFEFRCRPYESFSFLKKQLNKQKTKPLRVFILPVDGSNSEDTPILDISRGMPGTMTIHPAYRRLGGTFDLTDEISVQDQVMIVKINYMSFTSNSSCL